MSQSHHQLNKFISDAVEIHGSKYDYSGVEYKNKTAKVAIKCNLCGEIFYQSPRHHLNGSGCPKCARKSAKSKLRLSRNEFIERVLSVHGDKYDCSLISDWARRAKQTVICRKHGLFDIKIGSLLNGSGCPECAKLSAKLKLRKSLREFEEAARKIHGGKYHYIEYNGAKKHAIIKCRLHGEFRQIAQAHLAGAGCPQCAIDSKRSNDKIKINNERKVCNSKRTNIYTPPSNAQIEIAEYIGSDVILNDRNTLSPLEIDIFIPSKLIGIEYHGLYWHSYDSVETTEQRMRHHDKCTEAAKNGIRLIQIFEHHWTNRNDIVKSILGNILGRSSRVYARKTELVEISSRQYREFISHNHLYGPRPSTVRVGLIYNGELISCMGFHRIGTHWEITRFAHKLGYTVVGGASKILKFFIDNYGSDIITFADRCYSTGGVYSKLGFKFNHITRPNYFYIRNGIVYSRQQFQKHKLAGKLDKFDPDLTEAENMFMNGYRRIWDAGHIKFTL